MGNAESIDIPGGGTEGYHVLRVSIKFGTFVVLFQTYNLKNCRFKIILLAVE